MAMNLFSKIKNLMARGLVTLLEGGGYQVTLLNGETRSNLEHLQEFGLASVKPNGSTGNGVCVFYGGNRSNGSLLVMEFPDIKPTLTAGEAALFNAHNAMVKLNAAGEAILSGTKIELLGTTNEGIIKINDLTAKLNELVAAYNGHTHTYSQQNVGPTPTSVPTTGTPYGSGTPVVQPDFNKTDYENDKVVH